MQLVRPLPSQADAWTARAFVAADVDEVLDALTCPDVIAEWAPVGFELDGATDDRLHAGDQARVRGALAGVGATFEVSVLRADDEALELVARGPVGFDVEYRFEALDDGVHVDVRVALRRGSGLSARVLQAATAGLLRHGALDRALQRLSAALRCPERELIAA